MFVRPPLPLAQLVPRLQERGWIDFDLAHPKASSGVEVLRAVQDYQRWHGLRADGVAGPITSRHLAAPRFCSHPDRMALRHTPARWPHVAVTVCWDGMLPTVSRDEAMGCLELALATWARACALRPTVSTNPKTANIRLQTGVIDGAGKTLAWQQLPIDVRESAQLDGLYDRQEPWYAKPEPPPSFAYVDLLSVLIHELGHGWGLDHAAGDGAVMSAIYAGLRALQAWDVAAIAALYPGPGRADDSPPAPVTQRVLIEGNFSIRAVE